MANSILPLVFDEYIDWVVTHAPVERQSRMIVEMYEKSAEYVRNIETVLTQLNPKNFMFLDYGVFRRHVQMIKDLSEGSDWKINIEHPYNTEIDETMSDRDWLKLYLNPNVLTADNIARMDFNVCKIILTQLKSWYETGQTPACCLINYIDQIKRILCQSHTPEYIDIFNGLTEAYEAEIIADCDMCNAENAKNKRNSRFKPEKALKNIKKKRLQRRL